MPYFQLILFTILILLVIIFIYVIFIKNVGNLAAEQTISSRPLQIVMVGTKAVTSLPYFNKTASAVASYVNYGIVTANTQSPNQYFNLVPKGGDSSQIVIQDTSSGKYMGFTDKAVSFSPGTASIIKIATFDAIVASNATVFKVIRTNGNSYQFMTSGNQYLSTGPSLNLGETTLIPLILFSKPTNFSLSSA